MYSTYMSQFGNTGGKNEPGGNVKEYCEELWINERGRLRTTSLERVKGIEPSS